jgi:polyhydroxyalkanoate synthesis regulator protein
MPDLEERLGSVEHFTAALAEERRKDREEYKMLWRDTQRQLNELSTRLVQWGEEMREADERLRQRIEQFAEESRAADERIREEARAADESLRQRIDALVSGIGEFMRHRNQP